MLKEFPLETVILYTNVYAQLADFTQGPYTMLLGAI